jgi:hypothetical protein
MQAKLYSIAGKPFRAKAIHNKQPYLLQIRASGPMMFRMCEVIDVTPLGEKTR